MSIEKTKSSFILGLFLLLGLSSLGYLLSASVNEFKKYDRTVSVKGLSEREIPANIALWPIQFTNTNNDLSSLYSKMENDTKKILEFLMQNGFKESEITISPPSITDKLAQQYGNNKTIEYRYLASRTITVYTDKIDLVRSTANKIIDLGKKGIVFTGNKFQGNTEFLFTKLNDVKPEMIEEATRKAREVAEKFAKDSNSKLGKIKTARQGQFSINARDKNTPHIKKIRIVSTVVYYLSD